MKSPPDTKRLAPAPGPLRLLLLVCLIFVGAKLFVGFVALGAGQDPLQAESYARWDSGHYLTIASRGYSLHPCPPDEAARWCGNTGWMPGYSLLLRGLERAGVPGPIGGWWISALACFALLWLLGRKIASRYHTGFRWGRVAVLLGIAAAFPGMIYFHAIFPLALFTLLVFLFLEALEDDRPLASALLGMGAAWVYAPGILCAAVGGLRMLFFPGSVLRRLSRGTLAAAGPLLGFALALLIQFLDTGEPLAFFKIQRQYGREFDPIGVLLWLVDSLLHSPFGPVRVAAFQSLAVACGVVWLLWAARPFRSSGNERLTGSHLSAYLFLFVLWFFSVSIGRGISLYRSEACLMPAALLLIAPMRASPPLMVLLLVLLILAARMSDLFFRGLLV